MPGPINLRKGWKISQVNLYFNAYIILFTFKEDDVF